MYHQPKPSPGGWCSAQRIQNLYDCRWQSYLYYGGPAQAGPDEVEGHRFVTAHGDSRSLRPHQSQLTLRQLLLQEKPFLKSTGPDAQSQWLPLHRGTYASPVSAYGIRCASGHAAAPTCRNDTASRPSSVSADAEPLRNGMTATGSHEYFYSLRGAQPPGEGYFCFAGSASLYPPHLLYSQEESQYVLLPQRSGRSVLDRRQ